MELNLFITFIVILMILYWLYLYRKIKIEHFQDNDLPYHIWMYWENKKGNIKPNYLSLCYETIVKNSGDSFKVHLLNDKNIYDYLPNLRKDLSEKLKRIPMKADYIRYQLLYHYGGIWLDSDVIVFKNLDDLLKKLKKYDYIGFGCHFNGQYCVDKMDGYPKPANWVMISQKKGKLINEVVKESNYLLDNNDSIFFEKNYHIMGRKLLWKCIDKLKKENKNWDYLHESSKCVERDSKGNKITNQRTMSDENIDPYCKNNIYFLPIYNTAPGFPKWFLNMSKKEILKSNILLSKYFNKALK